MPTRPTRLAAVLLATLALAACSSSKTAPKTATVPSPTATTATTQQWASALAGPIKKWQTAYGQYQADACDVDPSGFACYALVATLSADSGLISDAIQRAQVQGADYIGPPPAALARLVQQTAAQAAKVPTDTGGVGGGTAGPDLASDLDTLAGTLDGWGPYLG